MNKNISVIIPTYQREQVLLDTLAGLIKQIEPGDEILAMDQTPLHEPKTEDRLDSWNRGGAIRWIRLKEPSITRSMNRGALEAKNELLLFLDDDIIPDTGLLKTHRHAFLAHDAWAVVGGVTQPWQSDDARQTTEVMAGNLSVLRSRFLEVGGFDENFKAVAYRFEKEFGERLIERGGEILFEPSARIRHLQAARGGVRFAGMHGRSLLPYHSVGEYYYFFRSKKVKHKLISSCGRILHSVCTKHHLLRPWWIPVTLIAETTGFFWGALLYLQGPRLLDQSALNEYGQ